MSWIWQPCLRRVRKSIQPLPQSAVLSQEKMPQYRLMKVKG